MTDQSNLIPTTDQSNLIPTTDQSNLIPTTDQQRILEAVRQCFEASPAAPSIGDVVAVVLKTVADIVTPENFTYYAGPAYVEFEAGQETRNATIRDQLFELANGLTDLKSDEINSVVLS